MTSNGWDKLHDQNDSRWSGQLLANLTDLSDSHRETLQALHRQSIAVNHRMLVVINLSVRSTTGIALPCYPDQTRDQQQGQHHEKNTTASNPATLLYISDSREFSDTAIWPDSATPVRQVTTAEITSVLGLEFDCVIYQADTAFDCDVFAASCGTLRGGGLYLLLQKPDTRNFSRLLQSRLAEEAQTLCDGIRIVASRQSAPIAGAHWQQDQEVLIETIISTCVQEETEHLLITADRGRGKSAALGRSAAQLRRQGATVVVSAPRRRATDVLYRHFDIQCESVGLKTRLAYCAPDALNSLPPDTVVIIDEAASIPLPLLLTACRRFTHVILASTTTGYEGAGRGFALRFTRMLNQNHLKFRQTGLTFPVRWGKKDPLEAFCNQVLLLDADLPDLDVSNLEPAELTFSETSSFGLVESPQRLRNLFGLLIQAHYRTRPADLQALLDNPAQRVFALTLGSNVVAVCLTVNEGPIVDVATRTGILKRRRRPQGHVVPQLLAQYTQKASALDCQFARVIRIAVHPDLQRQGLGSQLLTAVCNVLNDEGYDGVAAMFGALPETVNFWQHNNWQPCHLGKRANASSGYRSITMATAFNDKTGALLDFSTQLFLDGMRFYRTNTVDEHGGHFASLHRNRDNLHVQTLDRFALLSFSRGERSWMDSHPAIARLARKIKQGPHWQHLDETQQIALTACSDPEQTLQALASLLQLPGKKSARRYIEALTGELIKS